MKLWQKIFLYTLILVMLAVGVTSILLLENSFLLAVNQKKQSVYNEHEFAITSFKSLVLTERLRQNAIVLDGDSVHEMMEEIFGGSAAGNEAAFYDDELNEVYANQKADTPAELLEAVEQEKKCYMQIKNNYLYTVSAETIEGKNYYFVTGNDISSVFLIHENMLLRIQVISMGCAVGIALILLVVVKLLLKPLQKINESTRAIARGNYGKRVEEKGHDELTELARNMNHMAQAIEENVQALEDVAENRKRFIDNLSHEMKTPLTSILGFSDLLQIKREISDESRIEYAGIIKEEAGRMRTLSGKLMELITVGEANVEWTAQDMHKIFEEAGTSLKVIVEKHQMKLECDAQEGELLIDRELFKSLLYNLVDNAVKASAEGGKITVSGSFEPEGFCFVVEDEGVGIAPEDVSRITEAFYMVDKVRSRAEGGAGLGLALCREIVTLHRGTMRFESEPGRGTRVIVQVKGGGSDEAAG